MRKESLAFLGFLFVSIMFSQAVPIDAHSPSAVHLDYDFGTQVLTVEVTHLVANPNTHYIIQIIIEKNSVHFVTRDYTFQPSATEIIDTFDVAAIDGDMLTATAFCNSIGSLSESITVSAPSGTTTTTTPTNTETTTTTSTTTETTTTTSSGSTTSPQPPGNIDLTLMIAIGAVGVVIIVLAVVFIRR